MLSSKGVNEGLFKPDAVCVVEDVTGLRERRDTGRMTIDAAPGTADTGGPASDWAACALLAFGSAPSAPSSAPHRSHA